MTYLGIILDQKLNWSLHIKTKVSKAIKWLAVLKPAIDNIYGLSPSKMLWIYKQILLPRITYGAHVWGHSLTLEQQHTINPQQGECGHICPHFTVLYCTVLYCTVLYTHCI